MKKRPYQIFILLFACSAFQAAAQPAVFKGRITDAQNGEGLPLASLVLGEFGTVTDLNGNFLLQVPAGSYRFTASYVGYATLSDSITLNAGATIEKHLALQAQATILETATVTTGRYQKNISEVTVSLEVLKASLVENSNRLSLDKALEKIPGVSIIDGQANIRGGSGFSYGAGSRVSLLLDDIPILQADAGFPNWNDIPIENIGQIEVIKGAASALYGSAALNGVVNFRTTWPSLEPETKGAFFANLVMPPRDRRNQWWDSPPMGLGASISHKHKIGKLDFVAAAFYLDEQTHNEETFRKYGRFNLNTRYRISDRLAIGVNGNINTSDNGDFFYWRSDTAALSPAPGTLASTKALRFNIDPNLTWFDPLGNRHRILTRFYNVNNENSDQRSNYSRQHYLEYQIQRHMEKAQLVAIAGVVKTGSRVEAELYGDTTFTSSNLAAYLNLDKKFGDRLNLSLGMRYESNVLNNPGFTYPRGRVAPSEEKESKPVFRVGASYALTDFTFLRASWGQGYRYPTVAEKFIFTTFGGLAISPSPGLQSETGWSAEIGIKQGFKINAFEGFLDISAFQMRYENMMEFNFIDLFRGFQSINIGDTEIKGLELSVTGIARIAGVPITLTGGYLFIDPRFLDFDTTPVVAGETPSIAKINAINSSSADNILKYRSRHSFKMDAEAQIGKWNFGAAGLYASFQEAVDRTLLFFIPGIIRFRDANDQGHTVIDLRVARRWNERFKTSLLLNNALNEAYILRPGLMEAPRSLSLRIDWKL